MLKGWSSEEAHDNPFSVPTHKIYIYILKLNFSLTSLPTQHGSLNTNMTIAYFEFPEKTEKKKTDCSRQWF